MKKSSLIAILIILAILKLYKIDGGFVPAQPDERTYAEVVKNFHANVYPNYDGIAFFNSPPLFHYLSFIFSLLIKGYYLPLRLVSLLSSLILSVVIFLYLRTKHSEITAIGTACIFSLLPITVYFSRLGLIESLLALFTFLFIISFEKAWREKNYRIAFFSGAMLGLGVLTKYSLLPLVFVPVGAMLLEISRRLYLYPRLKTLISKELVTYVKILILIFAVAAVLIIPVLTFNYSLNPLEFKNQFKYIFGLGSRPLDLLISFQYITTFPTLFSLFPTLLIIGGISLSLRKANYFIFTASLLFLVYSLIRVGLFESRYVVILVPFLVVYLALALEVALKTLSKLAPFIKPGLVVIILGMMVAPASFLALKATNHTTITQVGQYLKQANIENSWVTTNYWPSAFVNEVGYKTTWITNDKNDAQAFSGLIGSKFISPEEDTLALIQKEGGWVIIETPFSKTISASQKRLAAVSFIQSNFSPVTVFIDDSYQWPATENPEIFTIYKITKKI